MNGLKTARNRPKSAENGPETVVCEACRRPLVPAFYRGQPRRWCGESCRHWAKRNPGVVRRPPPNPCPTCGAERLPSWWTR